MKLSDYSTEQLLEYREKIIQKLQYEYNYESALKEVGNAIYGCLGSNFYEFGKKEIAESITIQGRDLIKFTNGFINKYFTDFFHRDTDLHKKMNIEINGKLESEIVLYNDTDSAFLDIDSAIKITNWEDTPKQFIDLIFEFRLDGVIDKSLEKYVQKHNAENLFILRKEKVIDKLIFFGKKTYIYQIDNDISVTGFQPLKSASPKYSRQKISELINLLFAGNYNAIEIAEKIRTIKKQFKIQKIDTISNTITVNNLEGNIIDDYKELVIKEGCPYHVQAAATYNYYLNKQKNKSRYRKIQSGDKIRIYQTKDSFFAYQPGMYPYEFAPEIDYDKQFNKTILYPLNLILDKMNIGKIDENIMFQPKIKQENK